MLKRPKGCAFSSSEKCANLRSAKYSYTLGIHAAGSSVGEAQTGNNGPVHAALWTGTTQVTDLGTLGGVSRVARAINDSSQVVGSSLTVSGTTRAFGWDNTGTAVMTNLNDLIPGASEWVLSEVWDINNSGEIGPIILNNRIRRGSRGIGAWEVGLRISYIGLNDEFLRGGRETNLTVGLNWHSNENARVMWNYTHGSVNRADYEGEFDAVQKRFQVELNSIHC